MNLSEQAGIAFRNCTTWAEFRDVFLWYINGELGDPPNVPYTYYGIHDVPGALPSSDDGEASQKTATVQDVLDWVGNDPQKARAALQVESMKPADDRRKTLIDGAGKVADKWVDEAPVVKSGEND